MANGSERRWNPALIGIAAAVVVVAVIAAIIAFSGDDDDQVTTVGTDTTEATTTTEAEATTTTEAETTTTEAEATTTTGAPATEPGGADQIEASAVWPLVGSDVRYDDPEEAARTFAEDFIGFTDPLVGDFQAGDSRSGEVEVQPRDDGPVTTVLVRQLGDDDSWWVLGAVTANITVDQPSAGSTIDDPVTLTGQALAFEGTVQVEVRGDGSIMPLGEGFVTGSGGPDPGPFEGEVEWANPGGGWGALVFYTYGGEDPVVWEASVVRVRFADDV
jgi:hypothetical protein